LTYLAYASRHYGISLLYLSQDVIQMAPGYRKNFDFVFCLEASITDQQILYTELLSSTFVSSKSFREYYMANTGSFRFFQIYKEDGIYKVWPPVFEKPNLPGTEQDEPYGSANSSYPYSGRDTALLLE